MLQKWTERLRENAERMSHSFYELNQLSKCTIQSSFVIYTVAFLYSGKELPLLRKLQYFMSCLRDSFLLLEPPHVLYKTIIIRPTFQKFATCLHSLLHFIKALNWCISAIPKTSAFLINPKTIFIPTYHLLLCCDLIFWQLKVFSGKLDTDLVRLPSSLP